MQREALPAAEQIPTFFQHFRFPKSHRIRIHFENIFGDLSPSRRRGPAVEFAKRPFFRGFYRIMNSARPDALINGARLSYLRSDNATICLELYVCALFLFILFYSFVLSGVFSSFSGRGVRAFETGRFEFMRRDQSDFLPLKNRRFLASGKNRLGCWNCYLYFVCLCQWFLNFWIWIQNDRFLSKLHKIFSQRSVVQKKIQNDLFWGRLY